ncbi:ABC transporter substrate-binding protein [Phytoactinopolyspora halotolerans]|uniref:ABC transporter substrate-binding protein n=1 Tax=Phytoactinopolyspora halotolerans TaxID=1981512 RepID=A0A6L9SAN9_9ACTN|nr:ABC transporter substrate-binding protein [Phytoactinopolyspora halotolerans]NEE01568.1 ABC transporter substrate-binding protein [Phytoactinopolyspora halotolerans]
MAHTPPRTSRPYRTMSRRRLLQAFGAAGAGTLAGVPLLTACGSDDGSDSGSGSDGGADGAGGRITLGIANIMQFDPYLTNTEIHINTFYTYLVDYAGPDDYTAIPTGAESWEFDEGHTSVTIALRAATYHSGDAVTAADVVAGVERAQDPEAAFTLAQPSAFIDSATAVDELTVRLDFVRPTPEELVIDWMSAFPLVPADKNDPRTLENEPAGSGPFLLESFQRDRSLVLTRNPDFFDDGKPYLDEVEFRFFRDEEALVSALESGDVDGATYLALRNAERLRDRFTLVESPGRMDLFFMNGSKPPFDNKELRQAIARAIDRERIIEQVRFGLGEPVYTAFMPSSPAYDSAYLDSHGFDLAAAEQMLQASRGPTRATAGVGNEPGAMEILQIIQADLEKIGFELTIEPMEQTTFLEELFASNLECCVAAQPNNMQSPSLIARGRQMLPSTDNVMMGDNVPDAYVEAVEATQSAVSEDEQATAYARLNEVLVDEAWAVGISTRPSLSALTDGIEGLTVDPRDFLVLTETLRT